MIVMVNDMRIAIDGRPLQGINGHLAGAGVYTFELCKQLDIILPEADFFILSKHRIKLTGLSKRWSFISPQNPESFWFSKNVGPFCLDNRIDIFWGAGGIIPKLPPQTRSILTVYDLNHMIVPSTMTLKDWIFHFLYFRKSLKRADKILPISKGTADRLKKYYRYESHDIIYPAIDKIFYPRSSDEIDVIKNKYGIKGKYILSVATHEPRKNIEMLMRSYLKLRQQGSLNEYSLVLVGSNGWKNKKLQKLIQDNLDKGVIRTGYCPKDDLPSLYSGASLFVFPSIYEGFGIPVLEARACGAKILATDIPELREAGGGNADYIKPNELCDLDTHIAASYQKKQIIAPDKVEYSWNSSARVLAKHIYHLTNSRQITDSAAIGVL